MSGGRGQQKLGVGDVSVYFGRSRVGFLWCEMQWCIFMLHLLDLPFAFLLFLFSHPLISTSHPSFSPNPLINASQPGSATKTAQILS